MRTGGIEIRLLGRFAVSLDGIELPAGVFGGRRTRELIRILAVRRGAYVSKDTLTDDLWPERSPADPAANLDVLVSRARRALGEPTLILAGSGGLCFVRDDRCIVDSELFLARVEAGRAALHGQRPEPALEEFEAALDAWRGDPLAEDAYAEWAQAPRRALARAYLDALEGVAAAALATGQPDRAVAPAELAAEREPLREASHLLLAGALAASGDAAGALGVLDGFRSRLVEELGVEPSDELRRLQMGVLRGEPATPPVAAAARRRRGPPSTGTAALLRFVGRGGEVARIVAALQEPARALAVVEGRSGTGKSRLLAEVVARVELPVVVAQAARADQEEPWSLAGSLVREALALDVGIVGQLPARVALALSDVLPDLEELRPTGRGVPFDPETRRALALEGARRILGAVASPGAVVVDDFHWADRTSVALLRAAVRPAGHLGLLVGYRPEELARTGPAAALLEDLHRPGHTVLRETLGPLSPEAVGDLVADSELAAALLEETDGTPFAVAEALRTFEEQGLAAPDGRGRWRTLTAGSGRAAAGLARAGQRTVTAARVRWQPPRRCELLGLMALAAREVPGPLLAAATGIGASQLLEDLDALARAGLARAGEGGWSTAHDLVSEAVVAGLEPGERARLHGRLALALDEVTAPPRLGEWERARHLAASGDAPGAAIAYAQAAREALRLYESDDAEARATVGLGLDPPAATRLALLEIRGEARTRRGDLDGARADLRACLAAAASGAERAGFLTQLAMLTSGAMDLARASEMVELALVEAGEDPAARAAALRVGAIVDMNAGALPRSSARLDEALVLFERSANARGVADVLDVRAMAAAMAGSLALAADALGRAARLFEDSGDLIRVIWPLAARGAVLGWMGRGEDGVKDVAEALELARALGHQEAESYCLMEQSLTLTTMGLGAEAVRSAEAASGIAERIQHTEWTAAALMSLGGAHAGAGDLAAAEATLRRALEVAEQGHLPHFESWTAARLASVLVRLGDHDGAEASVARAFSNATPFVGYEGRLAQAELAAARRDPRAAAIAAGALAQAEAGGHGDSARRLRALIAGMATPAGGRVLGQAEAGEAPPST